MRGLHEPQAGDMRLTENPSRGVLALGPSWRSRTPGASMSPLRPASRPQSPFEEAVFDRLRAHGYDVEPQGREQRLLHRHGGAPPRAAPAVRARHRVRRGDVPTAHGPRGTGTSCGSRCWNRVAGASTASGARLVPQRGQGVRSFGAGDRGGDRPDERGHRGGVGETLRVHGTRAGRGDDGRRGRRALRHVRHQDRSSRHAPPPRAEFAARGLGGAGRRGRGSDPPRRGDEAHPGGGGGGPSGKSHPRGDRIGGRACRGGRDAWSGAGTSSTISVDRAGRRSLPRGGSQARPSAGRWFPRRRSPRR